jgi:hypothetical protein
MVRGGGGPARAAEPLINSAWAAQPRHADKQGCVLASVQARARPHRRLHTAALHIWI